MNHKPNSAIDAPKKTKKKDPKNNMKENQNEK